MFNLEKANTPAPMNIKRPNRTIGRRVNPNVKSPFSTDPSKVFCRLDARNKGLEPQAWRVAALSHSAITDEDAYTSIIKQIARLAVDTLLATADELIE
jgi:hypothetical protein